MLEVSITFLSCTHLVLHVAFTTYVQEINLTASLPVSEGLTYRVVTDLCEDYTGNNTYTLF